MLVLERADPSSFRKAMSCFATGITVVTVAHPQHGPIGVTINSLVSVSLEPLLVLFCLGKGGRCWPFFQELCQAGGRFIINVLASDQRAVSDHFTQLRSMEGIAFRQDIPELPPQLEGCAAYLSGVFESGLEGGDHTIYLGKIEQVAHELEQPTLLYHHSRYKVSS